MSGILHVRPPRICPHCGAGLRLVQLESVSVDVCPRCRGIWFDPSELGKAAKALYDERMTAAGSASVMPSRRRCPDCRSRLVERELKKGAGILVEQCPDCRGLFFEAGEYSRACEYLRGRPPREDTAERSEGVGTIVDEDSALLVVFQFLTGLPLELDVPQRVFSPVVSVLIVLNVVVLIAAAVHGMNDSVRTLGLVPAEAVRGERLWTLFTCMFMHAGLFHLLGNMYFLFVAGDNVEQRMGWSWFLAFYLVCGLIASGAHIAGNPASPIPCIGASGAISGVMGAYVVLFPRNRFMVRLLWTAWRGLAMPAWVYFGLWIALQLLYASLGVGAVAWWAHIGGFAVGVIVALMMRASAKRSDYRVGR